MAAIRLSDRELEALHGLPFAAVSLYVLAIRQRMDYATGIAGEHPRLSYQALSEWCRVESRQGVAEERLSRHQLARLLAQLERAGLIRRRPSRSPGDHLVFRCPMADRDSSVRKNPAQNPAQVSAQNPAQVSHRGEGANPAQVSAQNPAHHPGVPVSMETSSSSSTIVGGRPGADDDDDDKPKGNDNDLVVPGSLSPSQQAAARRQVAGLNGRAQAALDELAGYLDIAHQAGKPIRSPLRYLQRIVEQAQGPGWEPAQASRIAEARERYLRASAASPAPAERLQTVKASPEAAAAALAAIKTQLARGSKAR